MSPLREFKPEAADFLVRAPLTPPLPQLISPETGPVVGLSIANAMKQFGVGIGQIRHDLSAPFISDRCVEAWLGKRNARIRVTMDQIEVAVSEGKPRGWALGLPLFDALFLALSAVLPEAKFGSVITSWNLHLVQADGRTDRLTIGGLRIRKGRSLAHGGHLGAAGGEDRFVGEAADDHRATRSVEDRAAAAR